jgi:hypothetical protein
VSVFGIGQGAVNIENQGLEHVFLRGMCQPSYKNGRTFRTTQALRVQNAVKFNKKATGRGWGWT